MVLRCFKCSAQGNDIILDPSFILRGMKPLFIRFSTCKPTMRCPSGTYLVVSLLGILLVGELLNRQLLIIISCVIKHWKWKHSWCYCQCFYPSFLVKEIFLQGLFGAKFKKVTLMQESITLEEVRQIRCHCVLLS